MLSILYFFTQNSGKCYACREKDMGKCIRVRSLSKPFTGPYPSKRGHEMLRLPRAFHQHMFYASSTYVLRPINICSAFHQHIFYVSSTSHLRRIDVTSTSHLRRIYVSSTRNFEEKRKYMFRLSPNQVVLAAFSCTKQVYGKPKQFAWACHLLAKYLPTLCHLLAKSRPVFSFPFLDFT